MPNVHNDTEEDVEYVMADGPVIIGPDAVDPIVAAFIPAGKSLVINIKPPEVVHHAFFSLRLSATEDKRVLAKLDAVPGETDVRLGYSCVPARPRT